MARPVAIWRNSWCNLSAWILRPRDDCHASTTDKPALAPATGESTLFMVFLFMLFRVRSGLIVFALAALGWTSLCAGQASQPPPVLPAPTSGTISGTIVDQSGAIV